MRVKLRELTISGDMFPHSDDEEDQFYELSAYVVDTLLSATPTEVEVTDGTLLLSQLLTSKAVYGLFQNASLMSSPLLYKYFSGDVTAAVSEVLTYSVLSDVYKVDLLDIVPMRAVKYLGVITDAFLEPDKMSDELASRFGSRKPLFIEVRGSASGRRLYEKAERAFRNLETARYPNAYGLFSLVVRDSVNLVFVR